MRASDEYFEEIVASALDEIPDELFDGLENVVVTVADEPDADQLAAIDDDGAEVVGDELLGLYEGVPATERGIDYGIGELPDRIIIFKGPHERLFDDPVTFVDEVRRTVAHEVGHAFGNDEAMLAALGLD